MLSDLSVSAESKKKERIDELQRELSGLTGSAGMAVSAEIPASGGRKVVAKSLPAAKSKRVPPRVPVGTKIAPKYKDKATGVTWAGRGVQPIWVRDYLSKGGKLEELLIKKSKK